MFSLCIFQALQAPACHENMVKVGGYILGEFGNLIAGDPRSRLAHSLCDAVSVSKCWLNPYLCFWLNFTFVL